MKWAVPKHYFKLILLDGRYSLQERKTFSNLDINYKVEFNSNATVSGAVAEANITIYGLRRDTMNQLSTSYSTFAKNQIRNRIELIAGYDDKYAMIFSGDIIEAVPNLETANYSIRLKALSGFSSIIGTPKNYSFKGDVALSVILSKIASDYGFSFKNGLEQMVNIRNYSASDLNFTGHLRKLAKITGLDIYTYQNTLFVKKQLEPVTGLGTLMINKYNMIGSPKPTNVGCDVRIKLDPSVMTGQLVNLQTQKFTELNGERYAIQTISHQCDTKGSSWFTNLKLYRREILAK